MAARLDVNKDTVRRDLEKLSREAANAVRRGEPRPSAGSPPQCAAVTVTLTGALRSSQITSAAYAR
ncbi:DeoR family transcriptional regulator [Streptomyces sp. NPDC055036]